MQAPVVRRTVFAGILLVVGITMVASVSLAAGGAPASSTPEPPSAEAPERLGAGIRIGRGLVHAEAIVQTPRQGIVTIRIDRGTISVVDETSLTLSEAGDRTETIVLDQATRVRRNGARSTVADLKVGDIVRVVSRIDDGRSVAVRVVVQHAGG